jgi:hypothetical protein
MMALSAVEWGPIDADKKDPKFVEKWIEPDNIRSLLDDKVWLITGEKGSGKTAICRAIREKHGEGLFSISEVNFDKVGFNAIYMNLVELATTTSVSRLATLSNFWQFAILSQLVQDCARKSPRLYGDLARATQEKSSAEGMPEKLLSLLENCWNFIDRVTGRDPRQPGSNGLPANLVASQGLNATALTQLMSYPLDSEFIALKRRFFQRLAEQRHATVLLLDGFDLLRNDDIPRDGVRLIFESLIEAIRTINSDPDLPEQIAIKALVPHDRYLGLTLGDSDKVSSFHLPIRWSREPLRYFLQKRMQLCPGLQGDKFQLLWREVMPETVVDPHTHIEEDSFDYLLRHTMYRPRQLQLHLQRLAKSWPGQVIQPTMIPASVSESSKEIAKYFIDEYRADHPNLGKFIAALSRKDNIVEFKALRHIVADSLRRYAVRRDDPVSDRAVEEKIDVLYAMGFFGIVKTPNGRDKARDRYFPPAKHGERRYVDFYYLNPQSHVGESLADADLVAFHPVIAEMAEMQPVQDLLVG